MKKRESKLTKLLVACVLIDILGALATVLLLPREYNVLIAFWKTIIQNIRSIYSIATVAVSAAGFLIIVLTGKEIPKMRAVQFAIILFSLIFLYQCACTIFTDELGAMSTWALIVVMSLCYIFILIREEQYLSRTASTQKATGMTALALSSLAKKKIKKAHSDITSIQIHTVTQMVWNESIVYNIEYFDSARNRPENLNASLNIELSISKSNYDAFDSFQQLYNAYLEENSDAREPLVKVLKEMARSTITQLKEDLNSRVKSVRDITCKDACIGRLILVYLSCLACMDSNTENALAGVRCESLKIGENGSNPNIKEINQQILSKFHTGLLGSLLLKEQPYVFYYEGGENSAKVNRRYVSFLLTDEDAEKEFLILITLKGQSNSREVPANLLKSILSLKNEFMKCYRKHEVVRNENDQE